MNNFRKPYIAIFLTILILSVSCSNPVDDDINNIDVNMLIKTIEKHIVLTKDIYKKLSEEENIDFEKLNDLPKYFKTKDDLSKSLKSANIKNENEIAILMEELNNNLVIFLGSIVNVESYSKDSLEEIITNEIKRQYSIRVKKKNVAGDCEDAQNASGENCDENYGISIGVVILSGFISFGWGTAIGYIAATAIMTKCYSDAAGAYLDCVANEGI